MADIESILLFQEKWLDHFLNPNKRLYWGYLLSSCLIVVLVAWSSRHTKRSGTRSIWSALGNKKLWGHRSAKHDYAVWLINLMIKTLIITPLLFAVAPLAIQIMMALEATFGEILPIFDDKITATIFFTGLLFLLDDFTRFLLHWLLHKVPLLWHFHKVHHSAQVLTPITVYRIHPVESALYAMRLLLSQAMAIGLGFYLLGHKLSVYDILGANIVIFIFNVLGANLRHSHVWFSWPAVIERWLISPAQHQIHHSRANCHRDKNFGTVLAIWDRLFGCLILSQNSKVFAFGIRDNMVNRSLLSLYLTPIIDATNTFFALFKPKTKSAKRNSVTNL